MEGKTPTTTKTQMEKYKYSVVIDGYLIQSFEVDAKDEKAAKAKIRKQCGKRKVSNFIRE